jgi:hypothetical protein
MAPVRSAAPFALAAREVLFNPDGIVLVAFVALFPPLMYAALLVAEANTPQICDHVFVDTVAVVVAILLAGECFVCAPRVPDVFRKISNQSVVLTEMDITTAADGSEVGLTQHAIDIGVAVNMADPLVKYWAVPLNVLAISSSVLD